MIERILSMIPAVPQALLLRAAAIFLFGSVCYVAGNLHATERSLERRERDGERRMVEYHGQMVSYYAERMKELRLAREQQEGAANAAYDNLQRGKATAEQNLRAARAALAKALETPRETPTINIPSDPGCVMPPGVRQTINNYIASINSAPAIGNPISTTTGLPLGPASPDSVLACRELASGVIDILNHDAAMIAEIMSWRTWATEALK